MLERGGAADAVNGVREREHVGESTKDIGHAVSGGEEATEQELRKDERGKELDSLELGLRERAQEQAECHAHERVDEREEHDDRHAASDVKAEWSEDERGRESDLHDGRGTERERVADEDVELGGRGREEPFKRAGRAFAQHRNRCDEEHHGEGEQGEQHRADPFEDLGWSS